MATSVHLRSIAVNRPASRPALCLAGLVLLAVPVSACAQRSADAATLASAQSPSGADTLRTAAHLLAPGAPGREGAELRYWLRVAPRTLSIEILDARGRVVRAITSADSADSAGARTVGHHAFAWDLRHEGALPLDGATAHPGPRVAPGSYRVRLTVNGDTATRTTRALVVPAEAGGSMSAMDRGEQLAFLLRARDRSNEARTAVRRIHHVRAELADREKRLGDMERVRLYVFATVLRERLERIERDLHGARAAGGPEKSAVIERLASIAHTVGNANARPAPADYAALTTTSMELDKRAIELREELAGMLVRVNALLAAAKLEPIIP